VVTSPPTNTHTIVSGSARFSVAVSGTPPFTYQWQFNSNSIPGANSATLELTNVQLNQAGAYRVIIFSAAGSIQSGNATLSVLIPASITQHPATVQMRVPPDPTANPTNRVATFTAAATTLNPPLYYQWRYNGADLPGRTNASLSITNAGLEHEGEYVCAITDILGTITTAPARFIGLVTPVLVVRPVGQFAPAGGVFTHTAQITGNPPPFGWRWNSNSALASFTVSTTRTHLVSFAAMPTPTNAQFRLIVTNLASPGNTVNFLVTNYTLADFDRDGIADAYEVTLGLSTNNAADALGDLDGDGASNGDEYRAGTDPLDPASYLRVDLDAASGVADIVVAAVTNRSYTIQYSDEMPAGSWKKLADILGRTTTRLETNRDPAWVPHRYYRVILPAQP
jgi:Bacterial TSP3 repeat